jgi:hypothetical protein
MGTRRYTIDILVNVSALLECEYLTKAFYDT